MIFGYRNGETITEDEILVVTNEEKEVLKAIKVADELIDVCEIPCVVSLNRGEEEKIYYLQQGMTLYLIREFEQAKGNRYYIVYIVEQAVEYSKMKIKNIDSYVIVGNDELLLRYCVPSKVNEKKNITIGVKEILDKIKFMQEKEKEYLIGKIESFFNEEEVEPIVPRYVSPSFQTTRGRPSTKGQIKYDGKIYENIAKFARAYDINRSSIDKGLAKGMSLDMIVERYAGGLGAGTGANQAGRIGATNAKKVEYNGKVYASRQAFCKEFNINPSTYDKGIRNGMSLDEIVERYSRQKGQKLTATKHRLVYNGKTYKTISEVCKEFNMTPSVVGDHLRRGKKLADIIENYGETRRLSQSRQAKIITCNGITYPSLNEFAKKIGISSSTVTESFKKGMTAEEIYERYKDGNKREWRPGQPVECNGITFPSINEFANAIGVAQSNVKYWLERGLTPQQVYERFNNKKSKTIECNGVVYESMSEFARTIKAPLMEVFYLFKKGMTAEEIYETYMKKENE